MFDPQVALFAGVMVTAAVGVICARIGASKQASTSSHPHTGASSAQGCYGCRLSAKLRVIEAAGGPKVGTLAESIRKKIERSDKGIETLDPQELEAQEAFRLAEAALAEEDRQLR